MDGEDNEDDAVDDDEDGNEMVFMIDKEFGGDVVELW